MSRLALVTGLVCLVAASVRAQDDPVKVDPKHYKVEFENAQVRVLHVQYGPHEKSVMHRHPAAVAVFLNAQDARFTLPGGKTVERHAAAGEAQWTPAETHLPENLSDQPLELILVELKAKPGAGHGK